MESDFVVTQDKLDLTLFLQVTPIRKSKLGYFKQKFRGQIIIGVVLKRRPDELHLAANNMVEPHQEHVLDLIHLGVFEVSDEVEGVGEGVVGE